VNKDELFSDQYNKYLSGELRKAFGYEGCPIILVPRARPKTIEPKRRFKAQETVGTGGRPKRTRQTARDKGLAGRRPSKSPRKGGAR
jgi:hypothetical protein